jgi:biopolymer transport protein ExbD
VKRRRPTDEGAEINVTPMLDVVFILLIFFIVTTSFVKEEGLAVSSPGQEPTRETARDTGPVVVRINSTGQILLEGRILEKGAVPANLQRVKAENPEAPLIVAAHPAGDTEALVVVLDAAKAAGIESVTVATTPP